MEPELFKQVLALCSEFERLDAKFTELDKLAQYIKEHDTKNLRIRLMLLDNYTNVCAKVILDKDDVDGLKKYLDSKQHDLLEELAKYKEDIKMWISKERYDELCALEEEKNKTEQEVSEVTQALTQANDEGRIVVTSNGVVMSVNTYNDVSTALYVAQNEARDAKAECEYYKIRYGELLAAQSIGAPADVHEDNIDG